MEVYNKALQPLVTVAVRRLGGGCVEAGLFKIDAQNMAVEEEQGTEGLALGGERDFPDRDEVGEKMGSAQVQQ